MYSAPRLCPHQNFLSLYHQRHFAALCMLYKVNSNSNNYLFSELPSAFTAVRHPRAVSAAHPLEFEVSRKGAERLNLQGVSFRLRFVCGMIFPKLCLTPECWMGLWEQPIVGCCHKLCFSVFRGAGTIVGLRNQFINNLFFPTLACAAGLINK